MKNRNDWHLNNKEKFSGSIKEFVELMTPALRLPSMVMPGKWMLGQTLYILTSKRGPIITNRPGR